MPFDSFKETKKTLQACYNGVDNQPSAVVEWLALRTPNHVDAAASGRSRVQSPAGAL